MSFKELVEGVVVPIFDKGVIPLLYAPAFLFFLIGIVRYFFISGSEEARESGKQLMVWGIVGLVVIFSIWSIVSLLLESAFG